MILLRSNTKLYCLINKIVILDRCNSEYTFSKQGFFENIDNIGAGYTLYIIMSPCEYVYLLMFIVCINYMCILNFKHGNIVSRNGRLNEL